MSPKLADEARVIKAGQVLRRANADILNGIAGNDTVESNIREAARRELLRRSLFKERPCNVNMVRILRDEDAR